MSDEPSLWWELCQELALFHKTREDMNEYIARINHSQNKLLTKKCTLSNIDYSLTIQFINIHFRFILKILYIPASKEKIANRLSNFYSEATKRFDAEEK